jgi:DNA repair exonuclease SbcCD ATPase subunit
VVNAVRDRERDASKRELEALSEMSERCEQASMYKIEQLQGELRAVRVCADMMGKELHSFRAVHATPSSTTSKSVGPPVLALPAGSSTTIKSAGPPALALPAGSSTTIKSAGPPVLALPAGSSTTIKSAGTFFCDPCKVKKTPPIANLVNPKDEIGQLTSKAVVLQKKVDELEAKVADNANELSALVDFHAEDCANFVLQLETADLDAIKLQKAGDEVSRLNRIAVKREGKFTQLQAETFVKHMEIEQLTAIAKSDKAEIEQLTAIAKSDKAEIEQLTAIAKSDKAKIKQLSETAHEAKSNFQELQSKMKKYAATAVEDKTRFDKLKTNFDEYKSDFDQLTSKHAKSAEKFKNDKVAVRTSRDNSGICPVVEEVGTKRSRSLAEKSSTNAQPLLNSRHVAHKRSHNYHYVAPSFEDDDTVFEDDDTVETPETPDLSYEQRLLSRVISQRPT